MRKLYNVFYVILILVILTISILSVSADNSNSSNTTGNSTNLTNITKTNVTKNAALQPMSIWVSVSATPSTVNFGNLEADGTEHSYTSATNVTVGALGVSASLYVSASGDFKSGTNSIPLSNFAYGCPDSNQVITKKPFTTANNLLDTYSYLLVGSKTYHMNYFLTVPVNTEPGTYSTTIIYTAT